MNIVFRSLLCLLITLAAGGRLMAQTQAELLASLLSKAVTAQQNEHALGMKALGMEAAELALQQKNLSVFVQAALIEAEGHLMDKEVGPAQRRLEAIRASVPDIAELPAVRQVDWHILEGRFFLTIGDGQRAIAEGEAALEVVDALVQPDPALLAKALDFLGVAFWNKGEYERALDRHQQALILRERLYGEEAIEVARSLINLGLVYGSQGDGSSATDYYRQAVNSLEAAGAKESIAYRSALTNLGVAYLSSAEPNLDAAEKAFKTAESAWVKKEGAEHPNALFLKAYLGQVEHRRGNYPYALVLYKDVRGGYERNYEGHHPDLANVWNLTGQTYRAMGLWDEAIDAHQQALVTNHEDFNPNSILDNPRDEHTAFQKELVVSTLQFKALALEARYFGFTLKNRDLEAALSAILLASEKLERLRQSRVREADRLALGRLGEALYSDGVRICEELAEITLFSDRYDRQAFAFAEAGKAAVLQQAIAESEARSFAGIPDSVVAHEQDLQRQRAYFEQRIAENPYHPEVGTWYAELARLRALTDKLGRELEQNYPEYYALKYQKNAPTVGLVQQDVPPGTLLLSYYVRPQDGKLSIFAISQNRFQVVHTSLSESFEDWVVAMRNFMKYSVSTGYGSVMYPLYQQVFPKELRIGSDINQLVIVPHRQLSLIPWEALITQSVSESAEFSQYPFLIKRYSLTYAYSAGLYQQLLRRDQAAGKEGMYLMAPVDFADFGLADLPGTQQEVNTIAQLSASASQTVQARLGADASEAVLRLENLRPYKVVHLATHGVIDADAPALSRLYLSRENAQDRGADGLLYTGDIFGLQLDADLVCLSACETGLGKLQSGEGLLGLSRAFLYAGSRRLVVSLWTVNDQSTAQLTTQMYHHAFQNQRSWSAALRQSKLEMIRGGTYAAPYYWAPFVLVGRP